MNTEVIALAIIQGITEFLPISSSAHASLYSYFFGQGSHSITLDIALHFGSLLALLIFFYQEWLALAGGAKDMLQRGSKGNSNTQRAKILTRITLATLPLIIVAVVIAQAGALENLPRSPSLIAATSIVFALILLAADAKRKPTQKSIEEISKLAILGLGAVQCLALMPGASRAGVVMTIALLYGLGREQAARLALLTAMPALIGASVFGAVSVLNAGGWSMQAELASFLARRTTSKPARSKRILHSLANSLELTHALDQTHRAVAFRDLSCRVRASHHRSRSSLSNPPR